LRAGAVYFRDDTQSKRGAPGGDRRELSSGGFETMKAISGLFALMAGLAPWAAAFQAPAAGPAQAEPPRFERWRQGPGPGPGRFRERGPLPPGPRGPGMGRAWWKNPEVVRELELTPAQVEQIEKAVYDHRLKLVDLRADVERQELRLQPLVEAERPDEAKVGAQLDQVLAARGRLEKANTMMQLSVRRVLSPEQWKKLHARREQRPGWGGPGGPERRRGGGGFSRPPEGRPGPGEPAPPRPPE
jgi:Spy/CpxP family protein refolding chaperone